MVWFLYFWGQTFFLCNLLHIRGDTSMRLSFASSWLFISYVMFYVTAWCSHARPWLRWQYDASDKVATTRYQFFYLSSRCFLSEITLVLQYMLWRVIARRCWIFRSWGKSLERSIGSIFGVTRNRTFRDTMYLRLLHTDSLCFTYCT